MATKVGPKAVAARAKGEKVARWVGKARVEVTVAAKVEAREVAVIAAAMATAARRYIAPQS